MAGALRFAGRVLRGLIAGALLLALMAGLPWALCHYIGWPLPNHVPAWVEAQDVLLGPMTTPFLLDFLACLCWITWAAFTLDVLRCTVDLTRSGFDAARLPNRSAAGPLHALAGVLVGAVLLSVLGHRPPPAPAALSTVLGTPPQVVATAPTAQHPTPGDDQTARTAAFATQTTTAGGAAARAPTLPEFVVVRGLQNGVHDSLSRIAQRTLGDAARWPEIFDLNKGKAQPYRHTFINPNLIYPGEHLALPREATIPRIPPQHPSPPEPTTTAPPTTDTPSTRLPPSSAPSAQQAPSATTGTHSPPSATQEPGVSWGPELFVGLGLAAAISTALLIARRRYNNRYRPGSGDRDELPVTPVVHQLRLAHLRAEQVEIDLDEDDTQQPRCVSPEPLVVGAPRAGSGQPPTLAPGLGVRDGRLIALDLATARGLGLVGAGTSAAARALLVAALAASADDRATSAGATVVVPADDLVAVLGRAAAHVRLPAAVRVVADLGEALDVLEAETLVRAATSYRQRIAPVVAWPPLILVVRPPQQHQRLQAILDNGAPFGVLAMLLGQWQPGVTCYVREDGTISATDRGLGEALRGTRMFSLGEDDTTNLLDLLRHAQPVTPPLHTVVESGAPSPRATRTERANEHPIAQDTATRGVDGGVVASDAIPAADTEIDDTAVTSPGDRSNTGLEIIETRTGPPPGARSRTAAVTTKLPTTTSSNVHDHEPAATDEAHTTEATEPGDTARTVEVDRAAVRVRLTELGQPRVHWRPQASDTEADVTRSFQPRLRELLVFLGLHPDGATRESLIGALWAHSPPQKTTNALNTALSRLRGAVTKATDGALTDIIIAREGSYQLDPTLIDVDYWQFDRALARRKVATTPHERIDAYRDIINSYTGPLADGMSTEWIESAREAIRRDALDAVAALARALVDDDPEQTLDLLEIARAFDPHNELLYRDIMRLQERLGRLDAIPRTLTLLTMRLAEVDDQPTPQAIDLPARLRQRHETTPTAAASPPGPEERGPRGRGRNAVS